jgi:hypothetical protein
MLTNANLTIYNKYIDATTRTEKYQRAVIVGVMWENRSAANKLASGGQIAADKARVFVPFTRGANYVKPKAWQALPNKAGKWTIQEGDIIVYGLVSDEITSSFTVSGLQAKYDDVLTVTSIDRQDALSLGHWEVGAK